MQQINQMFSLLILNIEWIKQEWSGNATTSKLLNGLSYNWRQIYFFYSYTEYVLKIQPFIQPYCSTLLIRIVIVLPY